MTFRPLLKDIIKTTLKFVNGIKRRYWEVSLINCQHPNIKFTCEIEDNSSIFLDIKMNRDNNRFLTYVYRKPTFSGVFNNFDSYIPLSYKSWLVSSLLYGAFKLCSNFQIFHKEIIHLKDIFKRNGYPSNFIDKSAKTLLDKIFIEKKVFSVAQKKELVCVLLYW